jgi:hypothetical protein
MWSLTRQPVSTGKGRPGSLTEHMQAGELTRQYRCTPTSSSPVQMDCLESMKVGTQVVQLDSTDSGWRPSYRCRLKLLYYYYYYRRRLTRQVDCTMYKKLYICRLTGQMDRTVPVRDGHLEDSTCAGVTRQQNGTEAGWKDNNKSMDAGRSGWYRQYRYSMSVSRETSNYSVVVQYHRVAREQRQSTLGWRFPFRCNN